MSLVVSPAATTSSSSSGAESSSFSSDAKEMMFAVIGMIVLYEIFSYNSAPASSHVFSSTFGGITSFLLDVLMHPGLFLLGFVSLLMLQAFCAVNAFDSCTGLKRMYLRLKRSVGLGKAAKSLAEIESELTEEDLAKSLEKRGIKEMADRGKLVTENEVEASNARNAMKEGMGDLDTDGVRITGAYKSGLAGLVVDAGGIITRSDADVMNEVLSDPIFGEKSENLQKMLDVLKEGLEGKVKDDNRMQQAKANIQDLEGRLKLNYFSEDEKKSIAKAIRTNCIKEASKTAYLKGTVSGDSIANAIESVSSDLQAGKTTPEILRSNPGKCIEISKYLKLGEVKNGATADDLKGKAPSADLVQELTRLKQGDLLDKLQRLPSGTTLSNYAANLEKLGVKIEGDDLKKLQQGIKDAEAATEAEFKTMEKATKEVMNEEPTEDEGDIR